MSDRITLDPSIDPWERQPGETGKRYVQFLIYRDLGLTRTLTKAAEQLTLAYGSVRITSSKFRWQDRASAWDAHQQRQYTAELEEERRKAARDDAKILRIMTGMIGQALPNVQQIAPDMTVMEFTRFVETTMKLRRNLLGDPTETIAVTGPGGDPLTLQVAEFSQMPPEQRRVRLAELAASVNRRVHALDGDDDDAYDQQADADDQDDDEDEGGGGGLDVDGRQ